MTRVLHTARINGVMFVNRERRMVSLELSKEMEKDFFVTHTLVTIRKTSFLIFSCFHVTMFPPIEAL